MLASPCFARAERISKLLRFLVERHLAGRDSELKESLIGVEVYGRDPGYDTKLDSTVWQPLPYSSLAGFDWDRTIHPSRLLFFRSSTLAKIRPTSTLQTA